MKKPDKYHYHEALDRTYCISTQVEIFLSEHPVILKHKKLKSELDEIQARLADLYQSIGNKP